MAEIGRNAIAAENMSGSGLRFMSRRDVVAPTTVARFSTGSSNTDVSRNTDFVLKEQSSFVGLPTTLPEAAGRILFAFPNFGKAFWNGHRDSIEARQLREDGPDVVRRDILGNSDANAAINALQTPILLSYEHLIENRHGSGLLQTSLGRYLDGREELVREYFTQAWNRVTESLVGAAGNVVGGNEGSATNEGTTSNIAGAVAGAVRNLDLGDVQVGNTGIDLNSIMGMFTGPAGAAGALPTAANSSQNAPGTVQRDAGSGHTVAPGARSGNALPGGLPSVVRGLLEQHMDPASVFDSILTHFRTFTDGRTTRVAANPFEFDHWADLCAEILGEVRAEAKTFKQFSTNIGKKNQGLVSTAVSRDRKLKSMREDRKSLVGITRNSLLNILHSLSDLSRTLSGVVPGANESVGISVNAVVLWFT